MTEWLFGGGLVLVLLAVAGLAYQGRRDKLSLAAELHGRINGIRGEFDAHAVTMHELIGKLQPPAVVAAPVAVAPEPVPRVERVYEVAGAALPAGTVGPSYPPLQPKEEAIRDEMTEGPKLVTALPESKYPGVANAYGRVIHWYCEHPGSSYDDAYKAVVIDQASNYASVTEQPYQTGRFPIEALAGNVNASLYLNVMSGRYTATVHRSIWTDMLRGEKGAVGDFIGLGGSTNAGLMATFNVDAYSSPVKDAVTQAMAA